MLPCVVTVVHARPWLQEDVKEAHWHAQLPGVVFSTAADGFNVFKPDVQVTQ
jgi:hypothetical protein